jgi:hypothetical protein
MTWTTGFVASIVVGMSSKGSLFGKESLLGQRRDLDFSCRLLVFEELSPGLVYVIPVCILCALSKTVASSQDHRSSGLWK